MLKVFLDGSGKADDPQCKHLTLAAVVAEPDVWDTGDADWVQVLDRFGVPYSHMKEVLFGKGPFSDWEQGKKEDFISAQLATIADLGRHDKSYVAACCIRLEYYRELESTGEVWDSAEYTVAQRCLSQIHFGNTDRDKLCLIFDRGEPYFDILFKEWRDAEKSKHDPRLAAISKMDAGSWGEDRPIQIADFVAWNINRLWSKGDQVEFAKFSSLIRLQTHRIDDRYPPFI